jgi:hypothetical protein
MDKASVDVVGIYCPDVAEQSCRLPELADSPRSDSAILGQTASSTLVG